MKMPIRILRVYPVPAVFPQHPSRSKNHYTNPQVVGFPLRAYWQLASLLSVSFSLSIVGLLLLCGYQPGVANPFSAYHDIMPGHSRADAISRGASCRLSTDREPGEDCLFSPSSGPFETVKVVILNGNIIAVNFVARANALFVGDLEGMWGKPTVHPTVHENVVVLQWSQYHISATATHAARNSYSIIFFSVNLVLSTNDFPVE
jgi:hypothetical protein